MQRAKFMDGCPSGTAMPLPGSMQSSHPAQRQLTGRPATASPQVSALPAWKQACGRRTFSPLYEAPPASWRTFWTFSPTSSHSS